MPCPLINNKGSKGSGGKQGILLQIRWDDTLPPVPSVPPGSLVWTPRLQSLAQVKRNHLIFHWWNSVSSSDFIFSPQRFFPGFLKDLLLSYSFLPLTPPPLGMLSSISVPSSGIEPYPIIMTLIQHKKHTQLGWENSDCIPCVLSICLMHLIYYSLPHLALVSPWGGGKTIINVT